MVKIYKIVLPLLLFALVPLFANAANLSITPSSATFEVGDQVTLQVIVSSNAPLNAVSASLSIPQSIFSIESVSKVGSILNFWVTEPNFSKASGIAKFEGVTLGGFTGSTGTVVTIRLRAIKEGTGTINFQSGQVLANDGEGTDITQSLIQATYTVKEAKIKPKVDIPVVEEPIKEPADVPQPAPTLTAPEIAYGSKYGEPAIIGQTDYPKGQVLLTFTSQTGVKIYIDGITDANGDFTLLVPSSLRKGMYQVNGIVVELSGKNSPPSNEITIRVGSYFSDISWITYSLLALLILVIIYHYWRASMNTPKHLSKKIKQEVNEANTIVRKSFAVLRDDVKNKKTTELKKDINDAEDLITKEIKDIDSL